jgi:hypothetical protein
VTIDDQIATSLQAKEDAQQHDRALACFRLGVLAEKADRAGIRFPEVRDLFRRHVDGRIPDTRVREACWQVQQALIEIGELGPDQDPLKNLLEF